MKILRQGDEKTLKIKVTQRPNGQALASQEGPSKSPRGKSKEKPVARIPTGMDLIDMNPEIARELGMKADAKGAVVDDIAYEGAADRAGLMRGDVIIEAERKPVKDVDGFFSIVKEKKSYLLRVRRSDPSGKDVFTVVILDLTR
jgi:serine protease Do